MILLLITIVVSSCDTNDCKHINHPETYFIDENHKDLDIRIVDSCEYLLGQWGYGTVLTHKGNCKYCIERNKK